MHLSLDTRVGEAAAHLPRAVLVFEVLGIDLCCSGDHTLLDAAKTAGVAPDELLELVSGASATSPVAAPRNWDEAELPALTRHIVDHYHRGARRLLVELTESVRTLISGHGGKHPVLRDLQKTIDELAHDLIPHMNREERFLFPYIETMDRPIGADERVRVPLFGTVEYPLQSIRHDHSEDLSLLGRIRELSRDFEVPAGACDRHRRFIPMLKDFDRQLTSHIHLENDVLFPRAIAMEKKIASRSSS